MKIPLVDLAANYASIREELEAPISQTLASGRYILGEEVEAFEKEFAAYLGVGYAIGVSSGSEALYLAVKSLGTGPGDEVITTPFTFVATVSAITRCGATPVFADIKPDTLNLDPSKLQSAMTSRTKAVIAVHFYGLSCDMVPIVNFCVKNKLPLIEDCAQSLGATYYGRKTGTFGDISCFSFFPTKNLGACGDGGMVVTNNKYRALLLRMMRTHGEGKKYIYPVAGINSRLDALQAAILRVKLTHLETWLESRYLVAKRYHSELEGVPGVTPLPVKLRPAHSYNYFTVKLGSNLHHHRVNLQRYLQANGVASAIYYPLSLHLQPICERLGYHIGDLPVAEDAQERVLSLPMYPELKPEQVTHICRTIREYVGGR